MTRAGGCLALLALAGCHAAPAADGGKADQGTSLLRVVYRDADSEMVLVVPAKGKQTDLHGDCAAPLLVDARTGAARVLDEAEVQARLRTMQLAGATRGRCP